MALTLISCSRVMGFGQISALSYLETCLIGPVKPVDVQTWKYEKMNFTLVECRSVYCSWVFYWCNKKMLLKHAGNKMWRVFTIVYAAISGNQWTLAFGF